MEIDVRKRPTSAGTSAPVMGGPTRPTDQT